MAKITDKSLLNVGTELIMDEVARTYQLVETGNVIAKDWVAIQTLYSKFVDLWATATYQDSPFPMNVIDAKSGQIQIGIDAGWNPNGWAPADDATRNMQRDGWWEEYDNTWVLLMVFVGIVGLGSVNTGAQEYYQTTPTGAPVNFVYDDQCNQWVQVYWNAANGDFDNRTFFKGYVREQGKKYSDSILADTGNTATDAYIVNMLLSNETDLNITDLDIEMTNAPYVWVTIEYYDGTWFTAAAEETLSIDEVRQDGAGRWFICTTGWTVDASWVADYTTNGGTAVLAAFAWERLVGALYYAFTVAVAWNAATLQEIYTKVQYDLRQNSDIDTGAWTVIWQTADLLANFVGATLETTVWVYIDNIQTAEANSIKFQDVLGINRENPYASAWAMSFNAVMIWAWSSYRLMYTTWPWALDDYGEAWAITVLDNWGTPITWEITATSISFDFDYDNDSNGGTAASDKPVTLIGINPNGSKFAVGTGILDRSKAIKVALVAETDRAYLA